MKKIIVVLIAVFCVGEIANAQESTLDKVSLKICEYFQDNKEDMDKMDHDQKIAKFGLKMVEIYMEYEDDFKKEGIDFDLSKGASEGEKLGEMIGMNMVKHCPEFLLALAADDIENDNSSSSEGSFSSSLEGKIKKITGEDLYVLEVKDTDGKTQKLVWLTNFEGSDELLELDGKVKGKSVKVFFENIEFFSPKMQEYIVRKKITKLEFLD